MEQTETQTLNLTNEEDFYYSKIKIIGSIAISLVAIAVAVFFSILALPTLFFQITNGYLIESLREDSFFILSYLIFVCLGLYSVILLIDSCKRVFHSVPQLKIGEQGIWTIECGFYEWKDITTIDAYMDIPFRGVPHTYLRFSPVSGANVALIRISDLKNFKEIIKLIGTYKPLSPEEKKARMDIIQKEGNLSY